MIQTPRTHPRNRTPKKLYIVGGLSGFDSPDRYLNRADSFYLGDETEWQQMASIHVARESAGMSSNDLMEYCQGCQSKSKSYTNEFKTGVHPALAQYCFKQTGPQVRESSKRIV